MISMISLDDVKKIGTGLVRPECVLATASGNVYTADWRGGVGHIRTDGTQLLYSGKTVDLPEGPRPNGIALERDGSFLFANLGSELGGVWRIDRQGQIGPILVEIDGTPIPPSNFVTRDHLGRLWLTISTRLKPRSLDYRLTANTGFIILIDEKGSRVVADGLGFTNEALVDPSGKWLYVNETYVRRLSRFPIHSDGSLGPKEVVVEFGYGQFPDGMAFDIDANVWIAGIVSNQLLRVEPKSGRCQVMLEDSDREHVSWFESAYLEGRLDRPHMDKVPTTKLKNISSIAFGGTNLKSAYLGCLLGDHIATLKMPTSGFPPIHWNY